MELTITFRISFLPRPPQETKDATSGLLGPSCHQALKYQPTHPDKHTRPSQQLHLMKQYRFVLHADYPHGYMGSFMTQQQRKYESLGLHSSCLHALTERVIRVATITLEKADEPQPIDGSLL
jgi:hypothetical protein